MSITLAIAGCGVMGRRHVLGLKKLQEIGQLRFDLVAICDPVESSSTAMADLAEELLGRRPAVFADPADLPASVDALDVTTSPNLHATIGIQALHAGRHVQMEKPITLTIEDGRALLAAAGDRKLSVAENYRRDPINRLAKAVIDAGVLGRPFLIVQSSSSSGEHVVITPWRHRKHACGIAIDMGVHYADILEYLLGPLTTIGGMGAVIDAERTGADGTMYPADAEDLTVGIGRYASGALATMILSVAGRGDAHFTRMVYGTSGSLSIPGDRTGQPLRLSLRAHGEDRIVADNDLLALVPDFRLDDTTAALFGGERMTSYDLPWADSDANLLAIEFDDFAESILTGREPEVDGAFGLRSLAISYGFLESDRLGRFVSVDELLTSGDLPYQKEIEEALHQA
ncbi:MAG: Gfo/Idh/MocA family oxidoreductase [Thermomicrobiales bacterium]|nr:Gfo/Idh/MocA family oxidoreductase [Thermomicrobiales bacterium]MCO5222096.1 Gfo/Idh/MocA family oxidoreductase [Thermomicrobiales bacterium]